MHTTKKVYKENTYVIELDMRVSIELQKAMLEVCILTILFTSVEIFKYNLKKCYIWHFVIPVHHNVESGVQWIFSLQYILTSMKTSVKLAILCHAWPKGACMTDDWLHARYPHHRITFTLYTKTIHLHTSKKSWTTCSFLMLNGTTTLRHRLGWMFTTNDVVKVRTERMHDKVSHDLWILCFALSCTFSSHI